MNDQRKPLPMDMAAIPTHSEKTTSDTLSGIENEPDLEKRVIKVLRTIYDPEIPVNVYELGLIYEAKVDSAGSVHVRMTLTSPGCPVAGSLPGEVQTKLQAIPGVASAKVELVWDPPWDKDRMSEAAKLQLGLFD